MASRKLVTLGYVLVFWAAVPCALAGMAAWGQRLFGARLHLTRLTAVGIGIAAAAGSMLALSIYQFTRASGGLPVSAFPPSGLIRTGVFGIWRHPIYLFYVLFVGGAGLAVWPAGSLLIALPLLASATALYARREEATLATRFGRAYEGHRRQTSIVIPRLIHVLRWAVGGLCRVIYRFEVTGRENARIEPPFFVVAAHRNFLDPLFVLAAVNRPVHFVTTFEMFRKPAARFVFSRLLGLPKRRYGPDIRHALEVRRRMREACVIGVFPEAERSWTGAMIGFKPGALKLLRSRPAVPIIPVRLSGTYEAWPRWAPRPRRARISAAIGRAVFADERESATALASRLAVLITPKRSGTSPPRPFSARGIESVIYRCPECLAFDVIRSGKGGGFRCSRCHARFALMSDLNVVRPGGSGRESLENLSLRIRTASVPADQAAGTVPGGGPAAGLLAFEKDSRLETQGAGQIELSPEGVIIRAAGGVTRIGLETIRAVNVEGSRRLQIYGGIPPRLFQFTPCDQSALKWQHLIVDEVRKRIGTSPSAA